jgi:hypothetical protein
MNTPMKRFALVCFAFALVLLTALPASAVMVHTSTSDGDELTAINEDGEIGPLFCLDVDDHHLRNWVGTLQPGESFVASERICTVQETRDFNGSFSGGGGVGILYKAVYSKGQSISLHIVYPDGTIKYAYKTEGYNELVGCANPKMQENPDYRSGGVLIEQLPGGIYQVVLTNTGTKAINTRYPLTEAVWANTMFVDHQRESCPPGDWNIIPA